MTLFIILSVFVYLITRKVINKYERHKPNTKQVTNIRFKNECINNKESCYNPCAKQLVLYKSPDVRKTIITQDEFFKFIVPHVRLLGYWPEGYGYKTDKDVAEFIWVTMQNLQGWKAQQAIGDKWAYLNFDCAYTIRSIEQATSSYRYFKTAKNNGNSTVIVMTDRHHCGKKIPREIKVKDMELAYSFIKNKSLLVPFTTCPLNGIDGGGLCTCGIALGFRNFN